MYCIVLCRLHHNSTYLRNDNRPCMFISWIILASDVESKMLCNKVQNDQHKIVLYSHECHEWKLSSESDKSIYHADIINNSEKLKTKLALIGILVHLNLYRGRGKIRSKYRKIRSFYSHTISKFLPCCVDFTNFFVSFGDEKI